MEGETHTVILRIDAPRDGIDVALDRARGMLAGALIVACLAVIFPDVAMRIVAGVAAGARRGLGGLA